MSPRSKLQHGAPAGLEMAARPARPVDACVIHPGQVDKYQTVQFDRNRYSVPRRWAFRTVGVKGSA